MAQDSEHDPLTSTAFDWEPDTKPRGPMTREQQTSAIIKAIVAAVIVLIGAYYIMENRRAYEERYPGCWRLIGEDLSCKANHAVRRLGGY